MLLLSGKAEKEVGQNYTVELDRDNLTVTVYFKGKAKSVRKFAKFYEAINFYARIKKVKDAKMAAKQ